MTLSGGLIPLLLLNLIIVAAPLPQTETTFKVGAWGDDASRNNLGVQVQIETHAYNTPQNSLDYFWVGDDLSDGAFIQFGFSLEPGNYCLSGVVKGGNLSCTSSAEPIAGADARWQWQYWPNRLSPEYYFEIGPPFSSGVNGSEHTYAIFPGPLGSWNFALDGRVVANTTFPVSTSQDPAFVVAEGSASNVTRPLGPVRFGNMSYFNGNEWKRVDSLIALSYCGISVACAANQYGADAIGADAILAGSNVTKSEDGTVLWTNQLVQLNVNVHAGTQFIVTSPTGQTAFTGSASIQIPEGMFAYVSLPNPTVSTPGVLGWMGSQDSFQGWVGSVHSRNLTAVVLMNSDKTVTANWNTDYSIPFAICLVCLVSILLVSLTKRPWQKKSRNPRYIFEQTKILWKNA